MLNCIWGLMIIVGILYGSFTGNLEAVTNAAIESAGSAVSLCVTMVGIMSLWVGLMEIAKETGIITKLTQKISPLITFLFPDIPKDHPSRGYISTNMIANILGLGWAATPAGLLAMKELGNLEEDRRKRKVSFVEKGVANKEMCTFLIINISSLQLIPVNMIAYRSQYGSTNPTAVIGPGLLATLVSTLAGIIFCKIMYRKSSSNIK